MTQEYEIKMSPAERMMSGCMVSIQKDDGSLLYVNPDENFDIPQHLHIVDNGRIREGDWYLLIPESKVKRAVCDIPENRDWKKIVATTDKYLELPKIPVELILYYIKCYNEQNELIKVELLVSESCCIDGIHFAYCVEECKKPLVNVKTNKDNEVVFVADKKYSLKDLLDFINNFKNEKLPNRFSAFHHEAEISAGLNDFREWLIKNA